MLAAADLFATLAPTPDNNSITFDEAAPVGAGPNLILTGHRFSDAESLYASDGAGGSATKLLTAAGAAGENRGITMLTPFNDKVYFFANISGGHDSLLSTDGTTVQEVKRLRDGTGPNTLPSRTFILNDKLYFFFSGKLWSSDGTTAGTAQGPTTTNALSVSQPVVGNVFFGASGQLWRTDGTTNTLVWTAPDASQEIPTDFIHTGGKLYFRTIPSTTTPGGKVFVANADGTAAQQVVIPGADPNSQGPAAKLTTIGSGVVFLASSSNVTRLFGCTDGSAAAIELAGGWIGTTQIGVGQPVQVGNGKAVFIQSGFTPLNGLYVTDGTPAGTQRILAGTPDLPSAFTLPGQAFFLDSNNSGAGVRLLKTDGTTAGTTPVHFLQPDAGFSTDWALHLADVGNRAVLQGIRSGKGELWSVDTAVTTGSVTGRVYHDQNRNGAYEGFEPHMTGTVYVDKNNNAQFDAGEASQTLGAPSAYLFDGLPAPQQYVVRFIPQAGSPPITSPPGAVHALNLQPSQQLTADFSPTPTTGAVIWGRVFNDADADAVHDTGEGGAIAAQHRMYLDLDGDTVFDANEPSALSSLFDATYGIFPAAPGVYTVRRDVIPVGWRQTLPVSNGGVSINVPTASAAVQAAEFGATPPGTIAGRVWADSNGNGIRETGEGPGSNQLVELYDISGVLRGSTTTSPTGEYAFTNIVTGTAHRVRFPTLSGLVFSPANQGGDDSLDSDADPQNGYTAFITLAPSEARSGVDAGRAPETRIGGTLFRDAYGDGGPREPTADQGLPNWIVFVDADADDTLDAGETSTVTSGVGAYSMQVPPGTHRVAAFIPDPAYSSVTPPAARTRTVTIGQTVTDLDLGYAAPEPTRHPNPVGPEFRVNQTTYGAQNFASVGSDAAGNVVATWFSDDASVVRILGRRYDPAGNALSDEFTVAASVASATPNPEIAVDSAGNFVVAWQATSSTINARRFAADGTPLGAEFLVSQIAGSKANAMVAIDPTGGFAVAWSGQTATDSSGVAARRYDAAGNAKAGEFPVNDFTGNVQLVSGLVFDAAGRLTVAYRSVNQDGSGNGVYARRFAAADAAPDGPAFLVNVNTLNSQTPGPVAINSAGTRLFVWAQAAEVMGRMFAPDGSPMTGEFRIDTSIASAQSTSLAVLALADGSFVVACAGTSFDGSGQGAYAQLVSADGHPQGREFRLNTYTSLSQLNPSLAAGPGNTFFTAWSSDGQDGSAEGIYAQRFETFTDRASVGDFVWDDSDGDGIQDAGEAGLAVAVELYNQHGSIADRLATDASGLYRFKGLKAGDVYQVRFSTPNGKIFSPQNQGGNDAVDSDVDRATGRTPLFTAPAVGSADLTVDAGIMPGSAIAGSVHEDVDFDGVRDGGEPLLNGVTVFLDADGDGQLDPGETSIVSGTNGSFTFGSLPPGTYTVAHVPLTRWVQTTPAAALTTTLAIGQIGAVHVGICPTAPAELRATAAGPEFRVNATTAGDQSWTDVDADAAGNFVVVWNSQNTSVAQRYSATGAAQGGEIAVGTAAALMKPRVSLAADARFVVTWSDGNEVFVRRYAADGTPQGPVSVVNTTTADIQTAPDVAVEGDGDFVVTWQSRDQDGAGEGIYARRYDAGGAPLGGEFRVNPTTTGDQTKPSVATDAGGAFVVTWLSTHVTNQHVFAQRFDGAGQPLGGEFQVNFPTPTSSNDFPEVAMNAGGEFVVAYQQGVGTIEVRRFDAQGVAQRFSIVANGTRASSHENPAINLADDGSFFVAWQEGQYEIGAQLFNGSGVKVGAELLVNTTVSGQQFEPAVAVQPDGFVVTWSDVNDTNVAAQRFETGYVLPQWVAPASAATWDGATLTVTGPVMITSDPGAIDAIIHVQGASAVLTIDPGTDADVHLGALNLTGGAKATLASVGAGRSSANHRTLVLGSLSIDSFSTFDLTDNDLLIDYQTNSPVGDVAAWIAAGYNFGDWAGSGIVSSAAALDPTVLGLGYGDSADQNAGDTSVLIKFTYVGDLNLDGLIEFQDLSVFNTNYDHGLNHDRLWTEGDFNYDGVIDFQDLSVFYTNYDPNKLHL